MYEMFAQEFDEWRYFEGLWDDGRDRPMNWEHQGWNGLDCEAGLDAKNLCWDVDAMSRRGRQRQGVASLHSEPVGVDRPLAKENQEAEAEA